VPWGHPRHVEALVASRLVLYVPATHERHCPMDAMPSPVS